MSHTHRSTSVFRRPLTTFNRRRKVTWTDIKWVYIAQQKKHKVTPLRTRLLALSRHQHVSGTTSTKLLCLLGTNGASDKQNEGRSVKAAQCKSEAISGEVSEFQTVLCSVNVFQTTGTTEQRKLSLPFALHLKRSTVVGYNANEYPHEQWKHHLSYHKL